MKLQLIRENRSEFMRNVRREFSIENNHIFNENSIEREPQSNEYGNLFERHKNRETQWNEWEIQRKPLWIQLWWQQIVSHRRQKIVIILINETEKIEHLQEKENVDISMEKNIQRPKSKAKQILLNSSSREKKRTESNFLKASIQFNKAANGIALNEHG